MKTKIEELEQQIITLTTMIQHEFPELSTFILEMRDNNSDKEAVNLKNLEEYYNSLKELANKYMLTHVEKKPNTDENC